MAMRVCNKESLTCVYAQNNPIKYVTLWPSSAAVISCFGIWICEGVLASILRLCCLYKSLFLECRDFVVVMQYWRCHQSIRELANAWAKQKVSVHASESAEIVNLHLSIWNFTALLNVEPEQFLQFLYGFAVLRICWLGSLIFTWFMIGTSTTGMHNYQSFFLSMAFFPVAFADYYISLPTVLLLISNCVWMSLPLWMGSRWHFSRKIENMEVKSSVNSKPLTLESLWTRR